MRALPVMAGMATAPRFTKASGSASGTGALMVKAAKQATDRIVTYIKNIYATDTIIFYMLFILKYFSKYKQIFFQLQTNVETET